MKEIPWENPRAWLARIAYRNAAAWQALGKRAYPGEMSVESTNGIYRFEDGAFLGRARRPALTFDAPKGLRGMCLIGFLAAETGLWSLSVPFWRGAHAVLWRPGQHDPKSFVLTSPTVAVAAEERSGVQVRHPARPPSIRTLDPPSMTRLHPSS
jgi:hypothetical protein